jgi:hypothetical protein
MRRVVTAGLVAAIGAILAVAAVDVLRGPSRSPGEDESILPDEATVSQPQTSPPLARWQGVHRRTVRLSRVEGATWTEVRTLDPGSYALAVRIALPHGADVDIWFESATGRTIDLLGRGHPRDCAERKGQDVCLTRVDVFQDEAEGWRLIARKVFREPVVMRLRVVFEETAASASA